MKKLFILFAMTLSSITIMAEDVYVENDYGKSYNVIELGYTRLCPFGYDEGGGYLKYIRSCNMVASFNFDFGARVHFSTADNIPGASAILGLSYSLNFGNHVQFTPYTGVNLGYRSYAGCLECYADHDRYWDDHDTEGFALGWDIGARLKYRKVALSYTYSFGLLECAPQHFFGVSLVF